jgi:hypothetical protein
METDFRERKIDPDSPAAPIRRDYRPEGTYEKPTTWGVIRRTATEFSEDNLTDWAAALTYYSVLALFPALIALVSIVGLLADLPSTAKTITDIVTQIAPLKGPIESITSNQSAAGIMFAIGLVVAGAILSRRTRPRPHADAARASRRYLSAFRAKQKRGLLPQPIGFEGLIPTCVASPARLVPTLCYHSCQRRAPRNRREPVAHAT